MHLGNTNTGVDYPKRCGIVTVIGRTNAGKSSLVNGLIGTKIAGVSRKIQTTLQCIKGAYIIKNTQVVLTDTPGFVYSDKHMRNIERESWNAFRESEFVLFVVDASKGQFQRSLERLKKIDNSKRLILVLNKIDLLKNKESLLPVLDQFGKECNIERIFIVSCLTGSGIKDISNYLADVLPEGEWMFPEDQVSDWRPGEFAAEITREHLYHRVHNEVPYQCIVVTDSYKERRNGTIEIFQSIHTHKGSHKPILIGNKGEKIHAIENATAAELSKILNKPVKLQLTVILDK